MEKELKQLNELLADKTLEIGSRYIGQKCGSKMVCVKNDGNFIWGRIYRYGELLKTIYKEEIKSGLVIIGHPVTLARVLLKLREIDFREKNWFDFLYVDRHGWILGGDNKEPPAILKDPNTNIPLVWNLEKDTLEQQSEETILFLYELFIN
jgi:hypothetical protein